MKCQVLGCRGTLISEPGVETICLLCSRPKGESEPVLPDFLCQRGLCTRLAIPGQDLCRYHQGVVTKAGRVTA